MLQYAGSLEGKEGKSEAFVRSLAFARAVAIDLSLKRQWQHLDVKAETLRRAAAVCCRSTVQATSVLTKASV